MYNCQITLLDNGEKCHFNPKAFLILIIALQFFSSGIFAQGVGINSSGNAPHTSATLDVSGTSSGVLINRMTTSQRDVISSPAQSLMIYNITTKCFEFWEDGGWQTLACAPCPIPSAVTALASPTILCEGSTLTLTGGATGATGWSWTGPNGFNSTLQSPTISNITPAGSGFYTLTASNSCGVATAVSTASVTVNTLPTTANVGTDINPACGVSTATLSGNTPTVGTGNWSVVSGAATITAPGSPTSGVTGLAVPGIATLRWTISNSPCSASTDDVVLTTTACPAPGDSYQGGIIAYILQPSDPGYVAGQFHGIIAAPSDQSTGAEWGCKQYGVQISGADATAIGTGYQNTSDIIAGCATPGIAARLCRSLSLGGYNDWSLPSKDELAKLYINRIAIGGFANAYYWTSSEYNDGANYIDAWLQNFTDGTQFYSYNKDNPAHVRAVRMF